MNSDQSGNEIDYWVNSIHQGDSFDLLEDFPAKSVHAVVTDPPYGEGDYTGGFMGREWDQFDGPRAFQEWNREWAVKTKRVLKPGGNLLAFGSNDSHHRTASGIEDAGFEIRETITWHHGEGFPKALDVSKAIDKKLGKEDEREVVGNYERPDGGSRDWDEQPPPATGGDYGDYGDEDGRSRTAPATPEAEQWDGWKTHLKPATEFVVLARKPLEGTVAENVLEHGTGALAIDNCRLEAGDGGSRDGEESAERRYTDNGGTNIAAKPGPRGGSSDGRYPANVIFDEFAAEQLDGEVGDLETGDSVTRSNSIWGNQDDDGMIGVAYEDTGGPSRYFYTSKATRAERTLQGRLDNSHPTVKPQDLMEWLVRLVTAEDQIVLDPFAGTGTTCKAAKELGRQFIGIEQQEKWADVARVRCGLEPEEPSHVRPDDDQTGLEVFADGE